MSERKRGREREGERRDRGREREGGREGDCASGYTIRFREEKNV